jgi:serine/threonine-protein kinase
MLDLLRSGKLPIDADTFGKLIALLLTRPPEPLPAVTPKGERIPPALAAVVMKCLEKDPAKRPQSMDALVHSLTNASETTELVLPKKRSRAGLFVGVGAVVVAAIVGAVVLLQPKPVVVKDPVVVVTPPSVPDAAVAEVPDAGAVAVAEPLDAGVEEEPEDAGAQVAVGVPDAGVAVVKVQKPKPFSTALLEQPFALASPRFNKCVQSNKALLPAGQSSIALRFVFEKSGVSTDSTVLDSAITGELRACLVRVMKSIRIVPHTGPVKATVYRMPLTP